MSIHSGPKDRLNHSLQSRQRVVGSGHALETRRLLGVTSSVIAREGRKAESWLRSDEAHVGQRQIVGGRRVRRGLTTQHPVFQHGQSIHLKRIRPGGAELPTQAKRLSIKCFSEQAFALCA